MVVQGNRRFLLPRCLSVFLVYVSLVQGILLSELGVWDV